MIVAPILLELLSKLIEWQTRRYESLFFHEMMKRGNAVALVA
jgi:hypothetical protein